MPKLTIKKIESLIKRKEFGRHPDGNQLYLNIREAEEGDTGFWKSEDCKNVSEAAGFFLYTSGELLKTADKERKAGSEKKSEKSYSAALFFSELSANAAKNFEVFCKK